jgi:hypothetical protein
MKRDDLARLHYIRNQRKLRALERVASCQASLQRAEQLLAEANAAVSHHVAAALEQESAGLADMIGKTLSHAEISGFHAEMTILAERLAKLLAAQQEAGERRDAALSDLKAAAEIFQERHRSVEKLQYLMREESRKHRGRDLALAEASDDEFRPRPQILAQGEGPYGLRSGDA